MSIRPFGAVLAMAAMLTGCGGGGDGSGSTASSGPTTAPTTPGSVTTAGCSVRARQDWAAAQLREYYLFPETLPTALNPSGYATVDAYIDALTATARAQRKDRYFTYLTSIAEENAYNSTGSNAGYGFRLLFDGSNRLMVSEAFENSPAAGAGIQRGTEIVAIGATTANLRTVSSIIAGGGGDALSDALGPDTAGTGRVLQLAGVGGNRTVTVVQADFDLQPVSSTYGVKVIEENGVKVGYVNLRTFISPAEPQLRAAFANFRAQGVTQVIVDLRYNGGGSVAVAETLSNLLGGNRSTSDVLSYFTFRPEKSADNFISFFAPQPQSVSATKIAFIGTGGSASASELVINAFVPYLHANAGLIGTNTYGKPVGQIARDNASCDDRLRVIAFAVQNANRQGAYYDGLATSVEASCRAGDDLTRQMGDPAEASTRQALNYLAGRSCTPITATAALGTQRASSVVDQSMLLTPARPSTAQRETPGLF